MLFKQLKKSVFNCIDIQVVLKSVFEQPSLLFSSKRTILRFLMILWLFFILCMTSSYKGVLISTLVRPDMYVPNSLKDLLSDGYTFQVNIHVHVYFLYKMQNLNVGKQCRLDCFEILLGALRRSKTQGIAF